MLRRTRFSLSVSVSGWKRSGNRPTLNRKEWVCQWGPAPDDFFSEDEAGEYIQEWYFPYPGQKAFLARDENARVSASMPLEYAFGPGRNVAEESGALSHAAGLSHVIKPTVAALKK